MPRIYLVSSVEASLKAVRDILSTSPIVGLSCKGTSAGSKGTIYLVVMATVQGDVYAFDVRKDRNIVLDGALVRIFQSTDVVKVIHDCAPDAAALQTGFGVILRNIFDTQVAYRVLMEENGLPPRMLSKIAIFHDCDVACYTPSQKLQRLLREDHHVWARRPLTKDMLNTAAADVVPLVTTLFQRFRSVLKPESADWFECLCDKHRKSQLNPRQKSSVQRAKSSTRPTKDNKEFEMSVVKVKVANEDPDMFCNPFLNEDGLGV